jgi:hypothetical protein
MTLNELTHDEQLALVALVEVAILSDRSLSDEESAQVDSIVEEMGEEAFRGLVDEAESRFVERAELKKFLAGITRPEARELIYGTVLAEALTDTIPHTEAEFLEWLSREWRIQMQVEDADASRQG